MIQSRPWVRGEGPQRKCAIDSEGFLCGCELVGAETTECAAEPGAWSACQWTEAKLDCKTASPTDLHKQLDVTQGHIALQISRRQRKFRRYPTWLTRAVS